MKERKGPTMTATLHVLTSDEITRDRREILNEIRMSMAEAEERERNYELDPRQRDLLRRLRILDFIDY